MRLAILTSHPIQYYAPWFRHLSKRLDLEVLYCHRQDAHGQGQAGFGVKFEWDVPLLDGYKYKWLKNISTRPGLQSYAGCDTPELNDIIHPRNYDALLVIGWNRKSAVQGIRAAWRNKVPVLSRGDSQLTTDRSAFKRAVKYLPYRWALPRMAGHLFVGERNRNYLKHYGVRDNQLFFCPHFVDNTFFTVRSAEARQNGDASAFREKLRIPRTSFVALFVGKFIQKKRPDDFLRGCLLAVSRHKDVHAVMVGDGPLRSSLEQSIGRNGNFIHLAGFLNQSQLPACYAAANVLVLTSNAEETWGLVVNEAMACGLPCIVSEAAGCAPDMIEEGTTGWTYPTGDIAALAHCLTQAQRMTLDADALRRKSADYSMQRATQGLEQALSVSGAASNDHSTFSSCAHPPPCS